MKLLYIGLGGAIGAIIRYFIGNFIQVQSDLEHFPIGILLVNIIGCFLIGFLNTIFENRLIINEEIRMLIFVGILGGFTTFSTFGLDTFHLIKNGMMHFALLNVAMSVIFGLSAVWLGHFLAKLIFE